MARACVITLQGVGDHKCKEGGFAPVEFFGEGLLAVFGDGGEVTTGQLVEFADALAIGFAVGEEVPGELPVDKPDDAGLRGGREIVFRNNQIAKRGEGPRLGEG